jgi:uncharacterized protein involved in exopolysaccharide biosynthesis
MEAAAEKPAPASSLLPDPGQLWMIFRRRLLPFAAAALVVIGLVLTYVLVQTPTYEATSSVVIEPRKTDVIDINAVVSGLNPETNVIDTEVHILSSRTLAGRVAKALQIWRWPEYALPPSVDPNDPKLLPGTHPLAGRLQYNVTIRRAGLSFVITITARASDPELAALIANEYARQYIAQQSDTKNQATRQASQFLQARLDKMRDEVVSADQAVQNYKIAHGLMSAEGSTMAEQEVSTLNQQIAAARADVAEKEGRLAAARGQIGRGGGGQDVGAALSSGTVSTLRTREAETTQRLADLTTRYGELHPDVRKAKQELADVRAQLQLEINRIISSLSAEAQAAQSRLNSLTGIQQRGAGRHARPRPQGRGGAHHLYGLPQPLEGDDVAGRHAPAGCADRQLLARARPAGFAQHPARDRVRHGSGPDLRLRCGGARRIYRRADSDQDRHRAAAEGPLCGRHSRALVDAQRHP